MLLNERENTLKPMTQITEDYCSFETAKLLKEKGFDENCSRSYVNGKLAVSQGFHNSYYTTMYPDDSYRPVSAPSIQMAMKWLREVHKLYVVVRPYVTEEGTLSLFDLKSIKEKGIVVNLRTKTGFSTYEEACEAAIKYCLENLI